MGKPIIWYEENLNILRKHYGREPLEETRQRVEVNVRRKAEANGWKGAPIPTRGGVIAAAVKAGVITQEEADRSFGEYKTKKRRTDYRTLRGPNAEGHIAAEMRAIVLERDQGTCQYCGQAGTAVDHIEAVTRGGTGDAWNLTLACRSCNSSKSNKDIGFTLTGAMQRLLQGGWRYRGETLVDVALRRIEKDARRQTKKRKIRNDPLAHLTTPYALCSSCMRINDVSAIQLAKLKSNGALVTICGLCRRPSDLEPVVGLFAVGQRHYPYREEERAWEEEWDEDEAFADDVGEEAPLSQQD